MLIEKDKNYIIDNYNETFKKDFKDDQLKPEFILINDLCKYAHIYSYVEDDEEVGYCYLCVGDNFCLIDYIGIHKDFRRKGYGKKLLEEIFELYKEKEIVFLETEKSEEVEACEKLTFYKKSNVFINDVKVRLFSVDYYICTRDKIDDILTFKNKLKEIYKFLYEEKYKTEVKIK